MNNKDEDARLDAAIDHLLMRYKEFAMNDKDAGCAQSQRCPQCFKFGSALLCYKAEGEEMVIEDDVYEQTPITIHKWKLTFEGEQTLTLPAYSSIASVAEQNECIVLYAIVTNSPRREHVKVYVHGTGHPINKDAQRFIGTVKMHGGSLMFHVFEGERTDA